MQSFPALVADIGGTSARLARAESDGRLHDEAVLAVADYPGPAEAIAVWRAAHGNPGLRAAAIAIAAPVDAASPAVRLTNAGWTFDRKQLPAQLGLDRLLLLNDFAALALSLPHLPAGELRQVGGDDAQSGAAKALIGPGTGLGVSGLIPVAGGWQALAGEGGHVSLAAADAREAAILALARREHPHVSAERLVSGSGLPLLHRLVAEVDGFPHTAMSTPEIVAAALAGDDMLAQATLATFCAMLGGLAGNLALTLGAQGGVYIGGGIVPRLGDCFANSAFRERFEAKGRFASFLAAIPAYVILSPAPALIGAAQALAGSDPA